MEKKYGFLFFYTLFCVYVLHLGKYTLFPIPIDPRLIADKARVANTFAEEMNLIPFFFPAGFGLADMQVLLNIALTVPFGFGISFLGKTHLRKIVLLGLLVGCTIESLQLLIGLALGFPYRYVDINDVIMNFLGVVIGYGIFRLFSIVFIKVTKKPHFTSVVPLTITNQPDTSVSSLIVRIGQASVEIRSGFAPHLLRKIVHVLEAPC